MTRRFGRRSSHSTARPETEMPASWEQLLVDAVNKPGTISAAFRAFPNYSIGNQMLAMHQFMRMRAPLQPIGTYDRWKSVGRQVRAGEHATITLVVPRQFRVKPKDGELASDEKPRMGMWFKPVCHWFTMDQTDGPDVELPELPEWSSERALASLGVRLVPFELADGNVHGYSYRDTVAISPLAPDQGGTLAHELGHAVLHQGNGGEEFRDGEELPRNIREVEAETVALILAETLGLGFAGEHRGYIQHWLGLGQSIPADSARRIFSGAEKILRAGRPVVETSDSEPEAVAA